VTFGSNCSITLTAPIPISAGSTTIDAGNNTVTISGGSAVPLFIVTGNLTLIGLTLANGRSTNGVGGCIFIHSGATLSATSCNFLSNNVQGVSGAIGSNGSNSSSGTGGSGANGTPGTPAWGGAIYNLGVLSLINCTFMTNTATGGAGGNGGNGGSGGGTLSQGGNGGNGAAGAPGYGGAIYNLNTTTLINCTFSNNGVSGGNGGLGGTNGAGVYPGLDGRGGAGAPGLGGSVYNDRNLTIRACTFTGNTANGGISAPGGNQVNGVGTTGQQGGAARGGGVCNVSWAVATNSTFYNNSASGGTGGNGGDGSGTLPQGGNGGNGGDAVGGGLYSSNNFTVVNCTFAQNGAFGGTNGLAGSGQFAGSNGKPGGGGGGNVANTGSSTNFVLMNSLFSTNLTGFGFGYNGPGALDAGYNISWDNSMKSQNATSFMAVDIKLGPLADNGGPTFTMALLKGSPAIDAIPPKLAPPVDQRGVSRPQGPSSDIGAYEFASSRLPTISQQPADLVVTQGSDATFMVIAGGMTPLTYQWSFNSNQIQGATATSYTIYSADATNAGGYSVLISNTAGSTNSRTAKLTVLLPLGGFVREGTNALGGVTVMMRNGPSTVTTVTDANGFYTANLIPGTYTVTPSLTNYEFQPSSLSITIPPGTSGANFEASPAFTITRLTNGLVQLSSIETTGLTYRIQTSTNLVNWQDISTNPAPFQFTDGISNIPARFYRLVLP